MIVGLNAPDNSSFIEGDRHDDKGLLVDTKADSEEQAEEDALLAQNEEERVPNGQQEEEANLRDLLYKNGDEDNSTGDLVPPQEEPGVEQLQDERPQKGRKNESAGIKNRRETTHRENCVYYFGLNEMNIESRKSKHRIAKRTI